MKVAPVAKKTKPLLSKPLKQKDPKAEKHVKSAKKSSKKMPLIKRKAREVPVERKDVSKDPRLQDLQQAADAVLTLAEKKFRSLSKKQLFAGDAQPVYLQIHTFRIPRTPPRCLRFNLPHSIHEKTAEICLILADPIKGRKRDTEQDAIVEDYKEMLESKGVKNIKEVIPFNYLRAQFSQYEMKRRFASSYDVFLCDSRFIGHATHFLGKHFLNEKCITPIRVVKKDEKKFIDDLKSAIDFSLHKTWMRVHPRGTSFSVVVGNTKLTSEQISANVLAVFNYLQISFPGGLDCIKMALLKCHESHPVPVFVSLKPHNEVPVPVVRSINSRHGKPATGELSTLPGREVTVFPSGRLDVRNKMTPEDEEYEKIMGQESKWKRMQARLEGNDDEEGSEEEVDEEMDEEMKGIMKKKEGQEEGVEDKEVFSEKRDSDFRGKKRFQNKKFDPKKRFSQGKKFSHDIKSASGKKFPREKKFAPGKFDPKKRLSQGKKFSHGSKSASGKKFSHGSKSASGKKFSHGSKSASGKKFSHGSKSASGKKFSHEKKFASGKKFSPGKKTNAGKKLGQEKKKSAVPKQGKKASQKP